MWYACCKMLGTVWSRFEQYLHAFARRVQHLTSDRIVGAFTVAVLADAIQLVLGPLGWSIADEVFDVIAMVATCALLGFHPLLLPTFLIELVPVADMLPTWTGCVGIVVALRKREQSNGPQ